ncbi:MAG: hypothetical protein WEC00_11105 [Dongiaceae bacterium]
METRLTLRPGQAGTRKLVKRFGDRLLRVRYVYDSTTKQRLKTVELIVETVPWEPRGRSPRRCDDDVVYLRIGYHETELRERAKRLGANWRKPQRLWEITFRDSKRLGIEDRIVEGGNPLAVAICRHMALSICGWFNLPMDSSTVRAKRPNQ